MIALLPIGFVAGVIAGISPCILPVLPIVLVAGAAGPSQPSRSQPSRKAGTRRALAVVGGLVLSFSLATLLGAEVLSALGLPDDLLRYLGVATVAILGLSLLVPAFGHLLERPFARWSVRQPTGVTSGFSLGLGLGVVFVPCAGPVLATISVLGTTHRVGLFAVLLAMSFAAGAAVPLLIIALAGDRLVERTKAVKSHLGAIRVTGGVVLLAMALVIGLNLTDGLQRLVPGYTTALQNRVEGNTFVRHHLGSLTGASSSGSLTSCVDGGGLQHCGPAPQFVGITSWLNTPGDRPIRLSSLRGDVVLVDFWTYSCINCQRTLPHIEAWYSRYHRYGLDVVGVHTPEFAFEHVVSNVKTAAAQLGVHYPIAIDDNAATWDAYDNEYWPAEYLIDATGTVRDVHFAEGDYGESEHEIRQLLEAAHPGLRLPPPTNVPNRTPMEGTNPETYVGYDRLQYVANSSIVHDQPYTYTAPPTVPPATFAFSGQWDVHQQEATTGKAASLTLQFQARDVYLVLGGQGEINESVTEQGSTNSKTTKTIVVSGIPRLYTLVSATGTADGQITLHMSPGLQAYDFTFG